MQRQDGTRGQGMGSFAARRPEIRAGHGFECVKRKARQSSPTFRVALVRMLRARLTKDTAFFALPDDDAQANAFGQGILAGAPAFVFIHAGRAFGLALKTGSGALSDAQRTAHLALRGAGMRVEVARDVREALVHLRDMGIPLESDAGAAFHPWARGGERGR
jgi:hypothetical protein